MMAVNLGPLSTDQCHETITPTPDAFYGDYKQQKPIGELRHCVAMAVASQGSVRYLPAGAALYARTGAQVACQTRDTEREPRLLRTCRRRLSGIPWRRGSLTALSDLFARNWVLH